MVSSFFNIYFFILQVISSTYFGDTIMAESQDTNAGGWWGSWIQAARDKSTDAIEFFKRDLTEFGRTVQSDTSRAVTQTSSTLKETLKPENTASATAKVRGGLGKFLGGITDVLVIRAEDAAPAGMSSTQTNLFDRSQARLHALQVDPGTYCNDPSGSLDNYQKWLESFSLENVKGDISQMLVSKVEVRSLYTKLVPSEISHADFWKHYFYKLHQLHIDEARKLAMMKRVEKDNKDDSINWDDDEDSIGEENTAEQEQTRALEERLNPRVDVVPDVVHESIHEDQVAGGCSKDGKATNISDGGNDNKSSPETSAIIKSNDTLKHTESDMAELQITDKPTQPCEANTEITIDVEKLNTKVKDDMVVVSNRDSPSSESSGAKEIASVSEDWEQDFDIELTEEDIKAAEQLAQKMNITDQDYNTLTGVEDWENWE